MKIGVLILGVLFLAACGTEPVSEEVDIDVVEVIEDADLQTVPSEDIVPEPEDTEPETKESAVEPEQKTSTEIEYPFHYLKLVPELEDYGYRCRNRSCQKISVTPDPEETKTVEDLVAKAKKLDVVDPCDDPLLLGGCSPRKKDLVFPRSYLEYVPVLEEFNPRCANSGCSEMLIRDQILDKEARGVLEDLLEGIEEERHKCFEIEFLPEDPKQPFEYAGENPYKLCILKPKRTKWCTDTYKDCEEACGFMPEDILNFPEELLSIDPERVQFNPSGEDSYGYCRSSYYPGGGMSFQILDGVMTPMFLYVD